MLNTMLHSETFVQSREEETFADLDGMFTAKIALELPQSLPFAQHGV